MDTLKRSRVLILRIVLTRSGLRFAQEGSGEISMTSDKSEKLLDVLQDLQALGFTDYEARAYVALLRFQPATAYEIAKAASLPKANSYTVLESLSRKEAAQPVSESPVRYMAVPPAFLFERIAESTHERCGRLQTGLASLNQAPKHEYVWSVIGAEAVEAQIVRMIETARDHLWIKAAAETLDHHRPYLQAAAKRGVAILIILFGEDASAFRFGERTQVWLHEGNGIRVGISPYLVTLTRDFEEALVAELRDGAYGAYTRSAPLVTMADTLIRHEIYFAEIFARFGEEIQATFGPALADLRRKYLPREQAAALDRRLRAGGGRLDNQSFSADGISS